MIASSVRCLGHLTVEVHVLLGAEPAADPDHAEPIYYHPLPRNAPGWGKENRYTRWMIDLDSLYNLCLLLQPVCLATHFPLPHQTLFL